MNESLSQDDDCPLCKTGKLQEGEPFIQYGKAVAWELECRDCLSLFRQERGQGWHILADNFTKETDDEAKRREANARLLAAAPTLLELLKKAVARQGFSNEELIDARAEIKRIEGGG